MCFVGVGGAGDFGLGTRYGAKFCFHLICLYPKCPDFSGEFQNAQSDLLLLLGPLCMGTRQVKQFCLPLPFFFLLPCCGVAPPVGDGDGVLRGSGLRAWRQRRPLFFAWRRYRPPFFSVCFLFIKPSVLLSAKLARQCAIQMSLSAFQRRITKTGRYINVVCCEVKILHSEQNPGPSAAPNSFRGEPRYCVLSIAYGQSQGDILLWKCCSAAVLQCSKTITSCDRSQCVLLALSVYALGGD